MNRRPSLPIILCLIPSLLLTGCAHSGFEKVHSLEKKKFSAETYYQTPRLPGPAEIRVIKKSDSFVIKEVVLPKSSRALEGLAPLTLEYYLPAGKGPFPLILISPILGGKYRIERFLADVLVRRGVAALIVHRKRLRLLPDEGLEQLETYLRASVVRARMALDWVETQKEIDPGRIGSLGISLGGILNVVLAGVDKRVKVHVIAMAGGNLTDVICYTHVKAVKRYRHQFMKREKITLEELRRRLRETLLTDPMRFAHRIRSDDTLLFIAWFDMVIGRKHCRKLAKALGNPETYYFPLGHYNSVLTIPFVSVRAVRFFENRFKITRPDESARNASWRQLSSLPHTPPKTQDRHRGHSADSWR